MKNPGTRITTGKNNAGMQTNIMEATLNIYSTNNNRNYNCSFNRQAVELLNSEIIVFDIRNLRIRLPNLDDNKTFKLSKYKISRKSNGKTYVNDSHCRMMGFSTSIDNIEGKYIMEKEDD